MALGGSESISIGRQLGVQLLACVVTAAWSGVVTWGAFVLADAVLGARVDEEQEIMGLDLSSHEERGYDLG